MAERNNIEEIFSRAVRAGRRTYFFDVKSTRAGDYYLTITESKRDFNEDGTPFYKKHKIYLYKEDFSNFKDALSQVTDYIIAEKGEDIISNKKIESDIPNTETEEVKESATSETEEVKESATTETEEVKEDNSTEFTEVNFEDLGEDSAE